MTNDVKTEYEKAKANFDADIKPLEAKAESWWTRFKAWIKAKL